ncbi:MAG: hypothetical protein U5J97_03500 [Trueperaceae bacterium]|nr:hypothetical protein [Trueperaceae bacterium]
MPRWSARIGIALAALSLVALLAWVASQMVPTARISWSDEEGARGVTVSADLAEATCRKELTSTFPWVRISCDPKGETDGAPVPNDLDTAQDGE